MGAVGYFAVTSFHVSFRPMTPGLDPSWVYAINELPQTGASFGRDVVFSFGPLGRLLVAMDIGSNLAQAAVLAVASELALLGVVVYHYLRHRQVVPLVAFVLLNLAAAAVGVPYEYRLLLVLGLLLSIPPDDVRVWRIAGVVAGILAAVIVFAKISAGVAATAMLTLAGLSWIGRRQVPTARLLLTLVLPFLVTVGLLTFLLLDGVGGLVAWIQAAWQFTSGYSEAMSYPGPGSVTWLVLGTITVFAVAAFLMSRHQPWTTPLMLALGALILLALRHGIVRHYGRFVPGIVLAALATLVLVLGSKRGTAVGVAGGAVVMALIVIMVAVPGCLCRLYPSAVSPGRGLASLSSLIALPETRDDLRAKSLAKLERDRLPDAMVDFIRADGGRVDVIPLEIAFTRANGLSWEPNPVLQTYTAFTPTLDRWLARHFRAAGGPGFLLVQFIDIDMRHPMAGAPAMWQAILENYEPSPFPISEGRYGDVALLQRRQTPELLGLRRIGSSSGRVGVPLEVPTSRQLVFGAVHLHRKLLGRVAGLFWRVDPVFMDLGLADGSTLTWRILPSTAGDGMLLNHLPMTLPELMDLYAGSVSRDVRSFTLHGPGASAFESSFEVEWFESDWTA